MNRNTHKGHHTKSQGFTLIELVIVMTLIGIIVGMGLPQYRNSPFFKILKQVSVIAGYLNYLTFDIKLKAVDHIIYINFGMLQPRIRI